MSFDYVVADTPNLYNAIILSKQIFYKQILKRSLEINEYYARNKNCLDISYTLAKEIYKKYLLFFFLGHKIDWTHTSREYIHRNL